MAYKFTLSGTRRGPLRPQLNPFTLEPTMAPAFVMSEDEHRVALSVIARHGGGIEGGRGSLALAKAQIRFEDFGDEGTDVEITGDIDSALDVLFELATAGRMVVINTHEKCDEPVPVVTTADARAQALASEHDLGLPTLVNDALHFLVVLLPGHPKANNSRPPGRQTPG